MKFTLFLMDDLAFGNRIDAYRRLAGVFPLLGRGYVAETELDFIFFRLRIFVDKNDVVRRRFSRTFAYFFSAENPNKRTGRRRWRGFGGTAHKTCDENDCEEEVRLHDKRG